MPKESCAWFLCGDLRCLFFLLYDVEYKAINMHTMSMQTFFRNTFCTAAVRTDRDGHLDIHKQIAIEERCRVLHPFHVETQIQFNCDTASVDQNWN